MDVFGAFLTFKKGCKHIRIFLRKSAGDEEGPAHWV